MAWRISNGISKGGLDSPSLQFLLFEHLFCLFVARCGGLAVEVLCKALVAAYSLALIVAVGHELGAAVVTEQMQFLGVAVRLFVVPDLLFSFIHEEKCFGMLWQKVRVFN